MTARECPHQVPEDVCPRCGTQRPQFKHDCTACRFVGRSKDGTADLYVCDVTPKMRTYVARFSSDGPDYHSASEVFYGSDDAHLVEAREAVVAALAKLPEWR